MKIIRERILISHLSPYQREIVDEITLLNPTDSEVRSIFVFKRNFMPNLKVLDECGNELTYYTNDFTKQAIRDFADFSADQKQELEDILDRMKKHELFVIWITLPSDKAIQADEVRLIKLSYEDNRNLKAVKKNYVKSFAPNAWQYFFVRQKHLFSVPTFPNDFNKDYDQQQHDIFISISVPEGSELKIDVLKETKTQKILEQNGAMQMCEIESPLKKEDGYYKDEDSRIASIRFPPTRNKINFEMHYEIIPERSERLFYTTMVSSLIAASLIFLYVGLKPILLSPNPILDVIYPHLSTLYAGVFTASVTIAGLMTKSFTNKTRFWLILPIIITIIGFIVNGYLPTYLKGTAS